MNANLTGRFRFEIHCPDGTVKLPFGGEWVNNTVVDSGLNMLFNQPQASGTAGQIAGSGYGFLVPMTFCRLSEFDSRAVVPADTASWILQQQGVASALYTKSAPEITHVDYPDPVNSVSYGSDTNWVWATFQRTYVFAPQGAPKNWVGCGVSYSSYNLDYLFSRIVLPATLTVLATEELRVIYQLKVAIPKNAAATGLTSDGFHGTGSVQVVGSYASIFGGINANGTEVGSTTANTMPHILRGNGTPTGYLLTNNAFPAENTSITPTYAGASKADSETTASTPSTYTAGNFYRDFPLTWAANRPTATESDIRSMFLGNSSTPTAGIQWLMDDHQTKSHTHTLTSTFRIAWARP